MTWKLSYDRQCNLHQEACLTIHNDRKQYKLRGWYGPMAELILQSIKKFIPRIHTSPLKQPIEKQMAQFILMQASFLHQKCLHEFQVQTDTDRVGLSDDHNLAELLLFIRMTANHPCSDSIAAFSQTQIPWCDDVQTHLNQLVDCKLIQRVKYQQWYFYDKNPYPHNHIVDLQDQMLFDHHLHKPIKNHQKLILAAHF
jgi:hypothetical protein